MSDWLGELDRLEHDYAQGNSKDDGDLCYSLLGEHARELIDAMKGEVAEDKRCARLQKIIDDEIGAVRADNKRQSEAFDKIAVMALDKNVEYQATTGHTSQVLLEIEAIARRAALGPHDP